MTQEIKPGPYECKFGAGSINIGKVEPGSRVTMQFLSATAKGAQDVCSQKWGLACPPDCRIRQLKETAEKNVSDIEKQDNLTFRIFPN